MDAAKPAAKDYFIWDEELPGFGLRVFASGKRSYLVQYRAGGRTRRVTIGLHGVYTPEAARNKAKSLLGRIAEGENPAEDRDIDRKSITVKELCERYLVDADRGLILGKKRLPKKASTLIVDRGRIARHIIPLLGSRPVKGLTMADINLFMRDVTLGKTRADVKTKRHGRAIVRGGIGAGSRTTGLLGAILTYAVGQGIIASNPAHGVKRAASGVRDRFLSAEEYQALGQILAQRDQPGNMASAVAITRLFALTGCRRGEIVKLRWSEVDEAKGCFRLADTKEGRSIRPVGKAAFELLASIRPKNAKGFVFPGEREGLAFSILPKLWRRIFRKSALPTLTPHVLRHSFATMANELGYTEATISVMLGHSRGTITSRYVHNVDAALVNAANAVAGHIADLMGLTIKSSAVDYQLELNFVRQISATLRPEQRPAFSEVNFVAQAKAPAVIKPLSACMLDGVYETVKISNRQLTLGERHNSIGAKLNQGAVDMSDCESESIGNVTLREGEIEGRAMGKTRRN